MQNYLFTRDSRGAVRVIHLKLTKFEDPEKYVISRTSGIWNKKITPQPEVEILKGKVKRTIKEQALLEYNSLLKKYKDKGYKALEDFGYSKIEDFDPEKELPKDVTDNNGNRKPMLCKVYDANDPKVKDKIWYCSTKLDGVRCLLFLKDGELHTSSRGGQDYDIPATYIRQDLFLIELFKQNPDLILDGEIYYHGKPLSYISGLCRLETLDERHKDLQFHCYDYVDENKTFIERLKLLSSINPPETSKLKMVKHIKVQGNDQIMKTHNEFVSKGYEGAVLRDPDEKYKCKGRDRRMMKVKLFQDAEFEIKGLSEGVRDEDMCFIMQTKEGYEFKAKPIGDRTLKQWYRDNLNSIIGKMGVIKYFGMTTTSQPVPNLPVFKFVRDEKDI